MDGRMTIGTTKLIAPNLRFVQHTNEYAGKHFHLVAEEVVQSVTADVAIRAWGYNGTTPGPVIVVNEGDRVQISVSNHLSETTSIHWHGLIVPDRVDGVPGIGAGVSIPPGDTYTYEFTVRQAGTYMYHAHAMDAKQEMMGLGGMFIAVPRHGLTANREYLLLLQEWSVQTGDGMTKTGMSMGASREQRMDASSKVYDIDPMSMDFNYFTINGKAYPATAPLRVRSGEKVRLRLANLSMDSHPMHLHGHFFRVAATDGMAIPDRFYKNTINVAPGETWDIEFVANNPGVWAFHCHKPHHTTNDHGVDTGGMFTVLRYMN
ncbi:copper oxidase [Alicyclobacillus tolerans]|uniref:multicopper oxidase family protein n=1 Tax=Alicyclobacillus tolerans TaxID=90970 RepID=UPI001F1E184B|nr:copper oxidase [Alicyclobacillus tolerans]MCF8567051.1 copper oxidase [Alicyclobacillus tolerans]